jgi:DNA polymerase-3 subunit beta
MNFTTDPRKLASAVSWAASRVPSKPTVPILAGMLIEILDETDADVHFTGFDYEVSASATISADEWDVAGRCVVSGRLLDAIVKSLPPKPVTVDVDDDQMTLVCGSVRATLPLMPAEDYPSLPAAPEPTGSLDAHAFAEQVGRVLPACDMAGEQAVAALTGVHIAFADDRLIVTASNRYQLATNVVVGYAPNTDADRADFPILVPGDVLASVLKVCDEASGVLEIGVSDAVSFSTGERTTVSRLLDAKGFPSFGSRIPARSATPTVVDVDEVVTALKRASMVLDGREPVRLAFAADLLTMYAGSGRGAITAEMACDHQGAPVELVVNPTYFRTAIESTGASAELTLNGPLKPILVTAPKDADYVHLVMPIRGTK